MKFNVFNKILQDNDTRDFGAIEIANNSGKGICDAANAHFNRLSDAEKQARAEHSRKPNASMVAEGPEAAALLFRGGNQGSNN